MKEKKTSAGFPRNFVWGAATASFQIEGGATADGKGLSDWDVFCKRPGMISGGDTGDTACDHYHHWEEDVSLMAEIGLKAYRFSISWPRVFPDGTGKVNQPGLDFYDRLVDSLLEKGIEPWITLFHWDYPKALFEKGGWLNRNSSDWFAEYTKAIVGRLSDRVRRWITINEPQIFLGMGHQSGENAPGLQLGFPDILRTAHNCLLAHGKAVLQIRASSKKKPKIGAALVGVVKVPVSSTKEDIEASRNAMFSIQKKDCWNNSWFADPMILGHYPEDGMRLFKGDLFQYPERDHNIIAQRLDFYGVNIYTGDLIKAGPYGKAQPVSHGCGPAMTAMDWPVVPESLYWGPRFLFERYGLPIVVTENGMAGCDWVHLDGNVHDPQRIDFLTKYLREYKRAIHDGTKAEGYFQWSLMDNFEWKHGLKRRFGLIHVDFQTLKRTLKDSAYWYKDVIESNGGNT